MTFNDKYDICAHVCVQCGRNFCSSVKIWYFFTSTIRNKSEAVYTPPASISLAICRWCDICIFNVRNKDVVVVVVV